MSFKIKPGPNDDPHRVKSGDGVVYRCRKNRDIQILVLCTPEGNWMTSGVCPGSNPNATVPTPAPKFPTAQIQPRHAVKSAAGVPRLSPRSLRGFAQQDGNCEGGFMQDNQGKALSCPWCTLSACIDYCLKFQSCIGIVHQFLNIQYTYFNQINFFFQLFRTATIG